MSNEKSGRAKQIDAVEILRDARRDGRPIVPFLGAGLSAGSGFPLVEEIRTYLLKVRFYLRYGAFRRALQLRSSGNPGVEDPENNPSRYLTNFGWPNPNQLNSDLYRISRSAELSANESHASQIGSVCADWKKQLLERSARLAKDLPEDPSNASAAATIRLQLDLLPDVADEGFRASQWIDEIALQEFWKKLQRTKTGESEAESQVPDLQQRIWKYIRATRTSNPVRWGRGRWRLESAAQFANLEDVRLHDSKLAEAIEQQVWSHVLTPKSDWSRQLMQLSEGNLSLIDALIAGWGLRYSPALSHILLAQLVRQLNIRLLLSLNFDPYIEQTLLGEGLNPRVIEVTRDEDPPDLSVVRQSLTLIKLHGGSHSLRLGERLDYALDDDTRNRVASCVGQEAILLVIGFSGYERRMMQLIEHLAMTSPKTSGPRVLWMHFEPEDRLPATVIDLESKLRSVDRKGLLELRRLPGAGDFLFEAFQRLVSSYPKTTMPAACLPKRVIDLQSSENDRKDVQLLIPDVAYRPIHVFVGRRLDSSSTNEPQPESYEATPSLRMSRFAQEKVTAGYHLIWIDLEEHHTVSGVVTEIVDLMRVHDPDLPPLILPVDDDEQFEGTHGASRHDHERPKDGSSQTRETAEKYLKAVRFLHRALRRGSYFVAFDSLESFGREHTSHHGLPAGCKPPEGTGQGGDAAFSNEERKFVRIQRRVHELLSFLTWLVSLSDRDHPVLQLDWYCAIACDAPTSRHHAKAGQVNDLRQSVRSDLSEFVRKFDVAAEAEQSPYRVDRAPSPDGHAAHSAALVPLDNAQLTQQIHAALRQFVKGERKNGAEVDSGVEESKSWLEGEIPFYMLSTVRRPRSLILIDKLFNEFLSPKLHLSRDDRKKRIQGAIDRIAGNPQRLGRMQGGFYWIPNVVHEEAYKQITGDISWRKKSEHREAIEAAVRDLSLPNASGQDAAAAQTRFDGQPRGEVQRILERLVFVCLIHSRLARFYYLHVFQRTRDSNALYEYLYHRVSTLRYLRILYFNLLYLDKQLSEERVELDTERREHLLRPVALLFQYDPKAVGSNRPFESRKGSLQDLIASLGMLRSKFLQAMLNVLNQEIDVIFSQGSADTWIAWMKQIQADLERMVATESEGEADDLECIALSERIRLRVLSIEARLYRDKRDWRRCLHLRGRVIESLFDALRVHLPQVFEKTDDDTQDPKAIARLVEPDRFDEGLGLLTATLVRGPQSRLPRVLLDVARIIHKFHHVISRVSKAKNRQSLMVSILTAVEKRSSSDANSEHIDAFFESLIDVARCLVHLAPTKPGLPKRLLQDGVRVAQTLVVKAATAGTSDSYREMRRRAAAFSQVLTFECHRVDVEQLDCWSIDLDRDDAESSNKIADVHQKLTDERHKARGMERPNPQEFFLRRCQIRVLQTQCLLWMGNHRDALDTLNNAETGMNDETVENRSVLARISELRAHTLMRIADSVLKSGSEDRGKRDVLGSATQLQSWPLSQFSDHEQRRRWSSARGRLDAARQAVAEAEKLLRRGRRVAGQWIRLYVAKGQLEIEELLLKMWEMEFQMCEPVSGRMHFLAELHNILHRGLEAFRGGWDCVHAPNPRTDDERLVKSDRLPWLARWAQLMLSGYVLCYYFPDSVKRPCYGASGLQSDVGVLSRHLRNKHHEEDHKEDLEWIDRDRYTELWKSLNESVGIERLFERDRPQGDVKPRWLQLLENVKRELDGIRNDSKYIRDHAIAIMSEIFIATNKKGRLWHSFDEMVNVHCRPPERTV